MKSAASSKTIWLNIISIAIVFLTMFTNVPFISDPFVKELITAVVGILNICLRWGGSMPINKVV